jgi:hypothetical protein
VCGKEFAVEINNPRESGGQPDPSEHLSVQSNRDTDRYRTNDSTDDILTS